MPSIGLRSKLAPQRSVLIPIASDSPAALCSQFSPKFCLYKMQTDENTSHGILGFLEGQGCSQELKRDES
jgi:hypothetical protein